MRYTMIIGVDAKGARKEIHGPEVADKIQKTYFQSSKTGELPKGIVRIEVWERTRQTTGIDVAAQKARLGASKAEAKDA